MTISPEKQAANVANAQLSTGPRSDAGKATSARNAVTHGLTASNIIPRTGDEQVQFAAIREETHAALRPVGTIEDLLVDRAVHARCCLVRVTRLLGEIETGTVDDVLDPAHDKPIARLNRYYVMHERSLYRALRLLKAEQTNRALRERNQRLAEAVGNPRMGRLAVALKSQSAPTQPAHQAQEAFRSMAATADGTVVQEIATNRPISPEMRS